MNSGNITVTCNVQMCKSYKEINIKCFMPKFILLVGFENWVVKN